MNNDNITSIFGLALNTAVAVKTLEFADKALSRKIPKGKKSRKRISY